MSTGLQTGLKVQSLWAKECGKKFYCYYRLSIDEFKDLCDDMSKNRGYKLFDICCYLNEFDEVLIAAVWHNTDPTLARIEMPT